MKRIMVSGIVFLMFLSVIAQFTPSEYAVKFSDMAIKNMKESGVPASITLAQGILESSSGNSYLAINGNNHFGIKCHGWTGAKIYRDDDAENECFRKYNSVYESYKDHAEFLRTRNRYSFLFDLKITDYKGWARGLSKAGYATDPKYSDKLISLIERFELYIYDSDDLIVVHEREKQERPERKSGLVVKDVSFIINPVTYEEFINNNVPYVYAEKGDNIAKLSEELDLMRWQIRKYNDLDRGAQINEGEKIYIKPKRRRAERNYEIHIVAEGETMRDISQMYAVKLRRLYRMNNFERGLEVPAGTELNLRRVKR